MDTHSIWILAFLSIVSYTDAECTLPSDLQGKWTGEKDAKTGKIPVFWFDKGSLRDFNLATKTIQRSDFKCYLKETENDGTEYYVLKSEKPFPAFKTVQVYMYFCLAMKDNKYAIQTGYNEFLQDKLYAHVGNIELKDVCNEANKDMKDLHPRNEEKNLERLLEDLERQLDNVKRDEH